MKNLSYLEKIIVFAEKAKRINQIIEQFSELKGQIKTVFRSWGESKIYEKVSAYIEEESDNQIIISFLSHRFLLKIFPFYSEIEINDTKSIKPFGYLVLSEIGIKLKGDKRANKSFSKYPFNIVGHLESTKYYEDLVLRVLNDMLGFLNAK